MERAATTSQAAQVAAVPGEGYRSSMVMFSPSFAQTAAYRRWRNIGGRHQLYADEEIACFLMNCYDENQSKASVVKGRCVSCGSPLLLSCPACGRHSADSPTVSCQFGTSGNTREERPRVSQVGDMEKLAMQQGVPEPEEPIQEIKRPDQKQFHLLSKPPPPPPPPPPQYGHHHHYYPHPQPSQSQSWAENAHRPRMSVQQARPVQQQHSQTSVLSQPSEPGLGLQQNLDTPSQQSLYTQQQTLHPQVPQFYDGQKQSGEDALGSEFESPPHSEDERLQDCFSQPLLGSVNDADPLLLESAGLRDADQQLMDSEPQQLPDAGQSLLMQQQQQEGRGQQTEQREWPQEKNPPSPLPSASLDSTPSQEDSSEDTTNAKPDQSPHSPKGHKRKRAGTGKKEFFCRPCNKQLSSRQAFDRHVSSRLHAISLLPPEVQAKRRRRQKAVNPQQANQDKSVYFVVRRGEQEEYLCKVCSQAFSTITEVKQHRRQHKEREMCHLCGKTINVRGFRDHMLRHRGERQHSCPLCPKTFINAALLRDHAIVHTSEKPYCCEVCGACFRHRHTLKFHLRTHSGLKAYRCDQCEAAFTRPRGLSDHMRVHTGEKPYGCHACGRYFSSSGNLAAHRRKVHKMAPLLPNVPCRLLIS